MDNLDRSKNQAEINVPIDIQNLRSGEEYQALPDSCVIMICPFDLFGRGRHLYHFRNIDISEHSLELGDGADKIFLNSKGIADDIQQELRNFLDLVNGQAPADAYCRQIADSVYVAKHAVEVMRMFMNVNLKQMEELAEARKEALAKGHAAGVAEGRAEGHAAGVAETQARYEEVLAAKDAALASKDDEIARLRAELAAATQR